MTVITGYSWNAKTGSYKKSSNRCDNYLFGGSQTTSNVPHPLYLGAYSSIFLLPFPPHAFSPGSLQNCFQEPSVSSRSLAIFVLFGSPYNVIGIS